MNKKLITLAVAAAMVAPLAVAAETTLYGRIDTAIKSVDVDTSPAWKSGTYETGDAWDVDTGTTRVGLKGSEDLGNGLKAIFQAEWQFSSSEGGSTDSSFDTRLAYAGLSGNFGTVTIGRQWTPYYGAVDKTDIFNTPGNAGTGDNIVSANRGYLGKTRMGDQVTYASPDFSGFQVKTSVFMDRNDGGAATSIGESDGIDGWNPSITYSNGPIFIGASYMGWDNDIDDGDLWGISGSYNFGMFKLIAQYEDRDETNITEKGEGDSWALAGEAYFGNNTVRALYGQADLDDYEDDLDTYAISFQHNFSKRTRVYAEYYANDQDEIVLSEFALGLRHDF
jgi:predicted porin